MLISQVIQPDRSTIRVRNQKIHYSTTLVSYSFIKYNIQSTEICKNFPINLEITNFQAELHENYTKVILRWNITKNNPSKKPCDIRSLEVNHTSKSGSVQFLTFIPNIQSLE